MRRSTLLALLLAPACDEEDAFEANVGSVAGPPWNLTVQGRNYGYAADAVVVVQDVATGDVLARGDDPAVDGAFRVSFDDLLDDGARVRVHWWLDLDGSGSCEPEEAARRGFLAEWDVLLDQPPGTGAPGDCGLFR